MSEKAKTKTPATPTTKVDDIHESQHFPPSALNIPMPITKPPKSDSGQASAEEAVNQGQASHRDQSGSEGTQSGIDREGRIRTSNGGK